VNSDIETAGGTILGKKERSGKKIRGKEKITKGEEGLFF